MNPKDSHETPLKQALKQQFKATKLSKDELDSLRKIGQRQTPFVQKYFGWYSGWLTAACLSLVLIFTSMDWFTGRDDDLIARVSQEVSTNHIYVKPLDFQFASFSQAAQLFDRLDFNPSLSDHLPDGFALEGGRYCTLQGQIALLLQFANGEGERLTYYLTKDTQTFELITENDLLETKESGVQIQIWRAKGIVSAMAVGV